MRFQLDTNHSEAEEYRRETCNDLYELEVSDHIENISQ